mmetsp:Transcript_4182/g.5571  ORF Transcript_4182/g.5571 Transcript_4182/m.5571 type:complete len:575 (+) Transcript_4182:3-1727(+)
MASFAAEVSSLLAKDFENQLIDNPEFASQCGRNEYDNRLQDISPEAFDRRIVYAEGILKEAGEILEAFHSQTPDDSSQKKYLLLFVSNVEAELRALKLGCHLYPVNSIGYGGVYQNFVEAVDWLGVENMLENIIARLEGFPEQVNGYIELLRSGVKQGKVASSSMVRKIEQQLRDGLEQINTGQNPIVKKIVSLGDDKLALKEVISALEGFKYALESLLIYFTQEYIPKARKVDGCTGLSNGKDIYETCLNFHTTTNMTAEEIHSLGLSEVERIEERMKHDVLKKLSYKGSFKDFFIRLKEPDPVRNYSTKEELLEGYRTICKEIDQILPDYFDTFPKIPLEIVPMDVDTAPSAYYMQGTADGSRPGKFSVNVSHLEQRPKYEMRALALHEAVPGHHHQGSLAIENTSIPSFVRFIEDRRYEFCPARRQLYAAYLEGWGLYCEALGEEMGIYKTPFDLFGRLSMEMMRAVRLVVDTGIHHKGWTVTKAIEYMMNKTGMHEHECVAECYRYEAWPGQATSYKVGESAIWKMRKYAECELGDKFNIKEFHNTLLNSGPMPLNVLEEMVHDWVKMQN